MQRESRFVRESIELNREAINKLEQSKDILPISKFLILATYLGLKPVSEFQTWFVNEPERGQLNERIVSILDLLGLSHSDGYEHDLNDPQIVSLHYSIAKNKEDLAQLSSSDAQQNRHRVLGKRYGIPDTAIDAFERGEALSKENLPPEISPEDRKFLFFKLSESNWQSELEWLRNVKEKVRQISPEVYNQVAE